LSSRPHVSVCALLALAVSACGGGSSPTVPPQRAVVAQGSFSAIPSSSGGSTNTIAATRVFPFTIAESGTLDAVADWSSPSNKMGLALYPAGCVVGQLGFGNCNPLAQSNSNDKPGRVNLLKASAGSYVLGILNLGPGTESGTYEVGITR
jgi:hypothetical protein